MTYPNTDIDVESGDWIVSTREGEEDVGEVIALDPGTPLEVEVRWTGHVGWVTLASLRGVDVFLNRQAAEEAYQQVASPEE